MSGVAMRTPEKRFRIVLEIRVNCRNLRFEYLNVALSSTCASSGSKQVLMSLARSPPPIIARFSIGNRSTPAANASSFLVQRPKKLQNSDDSSGCGDWNRGVYVGPFPSTFVDIWASLASWDSMSWVLVPLCSSCGSNLGFSLLPFTNAFEMEFFGVCAVAAKNSS